MKMARHAILKKYANEVGTLVYGDDHDEEEEEDGEDDGKDYGDFYGKPRHLEDACQ